MPRLLAEIAALAALLLLVSPSYAAGAKERPVDANYEEHCAECHGAEGRGDGPEAASLDPRPSDLTGLSARAGGRFDEAHVMAVVDGRYEVAAHGPRDMPVWGAVFQSELEEDDAALAAQRAVLRTRALSDHLRTLQRSP